ncbi:SDR family NAD(P)-dependent oxidoreductase [Bacteriovoracaceae bacterium]|nr:SDR family NAD(P)-dependent oxidoreductase [Bacteriovoracaceae bacterium]
MKKKSVYITGGTSGIGWELAKIYLKLGHTVGICGRSEKKIQAIREQESQIPNFKQLVLQRYDISIREQCRENIQFFIQKCGLDLFIANAGVAFSDKKNIPNFEKSKQILDINVNGFLYSVEPAIEHFIQQQSGHLVGVSSIAAHVCMPGVSAYASSKAFVLHLMKCYQQDLRDHNINTTVVCPGYVRTELTSKNKHAMPQILSAEQAAHKIAGAISRKKIVYTFPFALGFVAKLIGALPPRILYFLLQGFPFKFSRKVKKPRP